MGCGNSSPASKNSSSSSSSSSSTAGHVESSSKVPERHPYNRDRITQRARLVVPQEAAVEGRILILMKSQKEGEKIEEETLQPAFSLPSETHRVMRSSSHLLSLLRPP
ncbi:hypothetical protein PBY51_008709 [Eleginops maclovinus]|uniref:Uncharacterized protein n=1 Tax=Eleginops maclovinus TaxID=56733 RepID=A0AAN7WX31_ELEMC|nr:hypothetical protein PBY51_008709 [Eleginops maclovinus]